MGLFGFGKQRQNHSDGQQTSASEASASARKSDSDIRRANGSLDIFDRVVDTHLKLREMEDAAVARALKREQELADEADEEVEAAVEQARAQAPPPPGSPQQQQSIQIPPGTTPEDYASFQIIDLLKYYAGKPGAQQKTESGVPAQQSSQLLQLEQFLGVRFADIDQMKLLEHREEFQILAAKVRK